MPLSLPLLLAITEANQPTSVQRRKLARWQSTDGSLYGAWEKGIFAPPQGTNKIAVSFSGGRTSAVMTKLILDEYRNTHEVVVTFANTGWEHEATLEFVRDCDRYWGFNTVWLEADFQPMGEGVRHTIVDYETASRNQEPFRAYIAKHGIPNKVDPGCSTKMKRRVMESYHRSRGWRLGQKMNYARAIGIRADEIDRLGSEVGIWYPLADRGITKSMVGAALRDIPWDLKLPSDAAGNCLGCFKKSDRKLFTLALTSPDAFDFPQQMEQEFGDHKTDSPAAGPDGRRHFYRDHRDSTDILQQAEEKRGTFRLYRDQIQGTIFDNDLDLGGDCSESCEAY